MVRIAVLGEQVSAQIRTASADRPRELDNVQVVFSGNSSEELRRRGKALRPQVLIVEMAVLGEGPALRQELDQLLATTEAELALVLYTFTRREQVQQLNSTRSRALKRHRRRAASTQARPPTRRRSRRRPSRDAPDSSRAWLHSDL